MHAPSRCQGLTAVGPPLFIRYTLYFILHRWLTAVGQPLFILYTVYFILHTSPRAHGCRTTPLYTVYFILHTSSRTHGCRSKLDNPPPPSPFLPRFAFYISFLFFYPFLPPWVATTLAERSACTVPSVGKYYIYTSCLVQYRLGKL